MPRASSPNDMNMKTPIFPRLASSPRANSPIRAASSPGRPVVSRPSVRKTETF